MKLIRTVTALACAASILSACGGSSDDVGKELGVTPPEVHFIHAIPSAPNVDFYNNGHVLQANLAYKAVTNFATINTGAQTFSYAAVNTTTQLATDSTITNAAKGHEYTVIALPDAGFLPSIAVIDDPFDKGLLSTNARVRGFNASANAQNLDLYLVAPGTSIGAISPTMAGVAYKNAVPATTQDSLYVSGGTYQLIATLPGSKTPVYTSASFNLGNNADWLVTTLPAGNALSQVVPNKIRLLVAQGGNTQTPAIELPDTQ
ncbi:MULTISPECIES: DUF4397 domain-containing protein [unclassified Caballeronia]|uniref:DUF4397 domain-containing protein n=1 Tax=unclassified Caballeronia TaxID=2646786 RepID=UPI002855E779|nr:MULTISPECIES: DUF4397 domain-containing protein [unclassified Caballeronia]MDR5750108.1 DUF4397 domain-containing protein [Caballeronia sp. LZ024]MDR5842764.1 DUF4397 domain-containing protein [Caballeronia sp. LZ031]